tara:strand:- start:148 stop:462 length:315 start_codon:yes stop_codon:yes gene_type:complete
MATSLAQSSYPASGEVILSATPNTMLELQLPNSYGEIEIVFQGAAGLVLAQGGTDNTVVTTEKGFPVLADSSWFFKVPKNAGASSVWIWSAVASTVVSYWMTGE